MLTALIVIGGLLLLLSVPVEIAFSGRLPADASSRLVLSWGYGLVSKEIRVDASDESPMPEAGPASSPKPRRKRRISVGRLIGNGRFRQRCWRFASDVWRAVRKDDVNVVVNIGTGDPADTGQLWAAMGPLSGLLRSVFGETVQLAPDFQREVFEARGDGRVAFRPSRLLGLLLAFGLSPVVWRSVADARA